MPPIPGAFTACRAKRTPVRSLAIFGLLLGALACSSTGGGTPAGGDAGLNDATGGDAAAPDGGGCVKNAPGTQVTTCSGLSVTVTAPTSCGGAGCGLVLDVHGYLMDADVEDAMTHLRTLAVAAGYVVVQPTAPSGRVPQGPAWLDADDAAVMAAVNATRAAFTIDPKKLHVTGLSQGGFMTWRFVCAHADVFASAAPALAGTPSCPAGTLNGGCTFKGNDQPSQKLPLLYMVGTKDALVPASCTDPQRDAVIAAWGLGAKQTVKSGTGWRRDHYAGAGGAAMDVLSHDGTASGVLAANAGHCVPGGGPSAPGIWSGLRCDGVTDLDWGAEALAFFVATARP